MRLPVVIILAALAACRPPAADDYVERVELRDAREGPSEPLPDPDVEGAIWAPTDGGSRLIYGTPGNAPMLALECTDIESVPHIEITRFVKADPQAKALMAVIGNSHIARLPVDAHWNGRAWLWIGNTPAADADMAVFTGQREVELTIPGAGSLILNPSPLPALLVRECVGEPEPITPPVPPGLDENQPAPE